MSIFFADFLASLTGIIFLIILFLNKGNIRKIVFNLKNEIIFFYILYNYFIKFFS